MIAVPAASATKGRIRARNQERILRAAETVFARSGFAGATMAAIAAASGLPKANVHYYFGSKETLYRAVLAAILHDWLAPADSIHAGADPRQALEHYIRAKMELSRLRTDASKVWANELLHGATVVKELLQTELHDLVAEKAAVVQQWVDAGRMAPVDGRHLFFLLWAATQTYADFDVQICAVLGKTQLSSADYTAAADHVVRVVLRGCGLD